MRFDFYCENRSGSTSFFFTPKTYWERGLGGAEAGLVGLTEELAKRGHEVWVWNTPINSAGMDVDTIAVFNGVNYRSVEYFDYYARYDTFICFRNPFYEFPLINAKHRYWWSTDQVTCGDYGIDIKPFADLAITISPYHRQHHIDRYGFDPDKIVAIDLGVRVEEYDKPVAKVPNRLLFCSVPSRGLEYLKDIFPRIREQIPDAELFITSDFSIWGEGIGAHNQEYKDMFAGMAGVHFLGKIPRQELVELQLSSDLLVYPNAPSEKAHAELFGVSVAECQVAGCVPVTSKFGALETTVIPDGLAIKGHPSEQKYQDRFVELVTYLLDYRETIASFKNEVRTLARTRFNWSTIADQWLNLIDKI